MDTQTRVLFKEEAIEPLEEMLNAFQTVINTPWVSDTEGGNVQVHEFLKNVQEDYAETLECIVDLYHNK